MDINLLMIKRNCLVSWFTLNCLFSHTYAQKLGFIYWLQLAMTHSQTLRLVVMHIKLRQNICYTHVNYHRWHPITSTSMFFFCFSWWRRCVGDHAQGDITKFGKRLEGGKEKIRIPLIIWQLVGTYFRNVATLDNFPS
jgi:hypothetical protein